MMRGNRITTAAVVALQACLLLGVAHAQIALTADEAVNLGIRIETAQRTRVSRTTPATGVVLDAAPLLQTLGEYRAAMAALSASNAEVERSTRLYSQDASVAKKSL